ncbi:MAG: hypothetical protein LBO80_03845 [Treponema sp.]|jgi:hypothetical protein|nr:hypothetical protein [Treponema sp.]
MDRQEGIFLPLKDCIALFPRLKRDEAILTVSERGALLKIEKVLYNYLSIQEVENLLYAPRTGSGGPAQSPKMR